MKSKIAGALVLALLMTTLITPTVFAADDYDTKFFSFNLSDKSGNQGAYKWSSNTIKKETTRKYAAIAMTYYYPRPTAPLKACILNEDHDAAVTNTVWYSSSDEFVKPKFNSPSSAKGDYFRAAMRLNTDDRNASVDVVGKYAVDYSNS
jgi:hypothetical protein